MGDTVSLFSPYYNLLSFSIPLQSPPPPPPPPMCESHTVADLIHNAERRIEWDSFFDIIEVVEEHKNFRVVYW